MNLLQLIFPLKCSGCGCYHPEGFCNACLRKVSKRSLFQINPLTRILSLGAYLSPLREAVWDLKFNHKGVLGKLFGRELSVIIKEVGWNFDYITAVPTSPLRIRERGYNQAELLAVEMAKYLNARNITLLTCRQNKKSQISLPQSERTKNVQGAFDVIPKIDLVGKTLLLVDDVVTTGSTLIECANVLQEVGAEKIYGICMAKEELTL